MHRIVALWLAAAALAGCSTSSPEPQVAAVLTAIRAADTPDRIHTLNQAVFRHRGDSASLVPLLVDGYPRVRWGAAYVAALWADDDADVAALAPYMTDGDEAVRAMIAGSLAGLGHAGARASLATLTVSTAVMPFSDPPITVGRFANDALTAIDQAGGAR